MGIKLKDNRDISLTNKFRYIDKVGVELEGGWDIKPPSLEIAGDGSVRCDGEFKGEIRVGPCVSMDILFGGMKEAMPKYSDTSCGMHIHMSMPNMYYDRLTENSFWRYFLKRMKALEAFIPDTIDKESFGNRLKGRNQFCRRRFYPETQLGLNTRQARNRRSSNSRYTMLNFCAYRGHKTLEVRLLPMFHRFSTAKMATYEVLDTVESYLDTIKISKRVVRLDIAVPKAKNVIVESVNVLTYGDTKREVVCV